MCKQKSLGWIVTYIVWILWIINIGEMKAQEVRLYYLDQDGSKI